MPGNPEYQAPELDVRSQAEKAVLDLCKKHGVSNVWEGIAKDKAKEGRILKDEEEGVGFCAEFMDNAEQFRGLPEFANVVLQAVEASRVAASIFMENPGRFEGMEGFERVCDVAGRHLLAELEAERRSTPNNGYHAVLLNLGIRAVLEKVMAFREAEIARLIEQGRRNLDFLLEMAGAPDTLEEVAKVAPETAALLEGALIGGLRREVSLAQKFLGHLEGHKGMVRFEEAREAAEACVAENRKEEGGGR